jgi:hypothetical protein
MDVKAYNIGVYLWCYILAIWLRCIKDRLIFLLGKVLVYRILYPYYTNIESFIRFGGIDRKR